MGIGKTHSLPNRTVDPGRRDFSLRVVAVHVAVAQIVGQQKDDVRALRGSSGLRSHRLCLRRRTRNPAQHSRQYRRFHKFHRRNIRPDLGPYFGIRNFVSVSIVFHRIILIAEVENKLEEQKSRALAAVAKSIQAKLIASTRNLLRLFEEQILLGHGIDNLPERQRKAETLQEAEDRAMNAGRGGIPWPGKAGPALHSIHSSKRQVHPMVARRNHLHLERSRDQALKRLAKIYAKA